MITSRSAVARVQLLNAWSRCQSCSSDRWRYRRIHWERYAVSWTSYAIATNDGLIVPVIGNCADCNIGNLAVYDTSVGRWLPQDDEYCYAQVSA